MAYEGQEWRRQRGGGNIVAWLALFLTLLGAAFTLYGELKQIQARQDALDQEHHEMFRRIDELEQLVRQPRARP